MKMTYGEAIREGMSIKMREDDRVVLFGEDVGLFGGCFGVSAGMFHEFGGERVRDTPISEAAIMGMAVGSAASGMRPIAELMFVDFLTVAMDQLVNQAAKMRYMFGGSLAVPLVVRLPGGAGSRAAAQHSQTLESWIYHVPGLKTVYPSCSADALGLMLSSIEDDNPVCYCEHKMLYAVPFEVEEPFKKVPLGVADIKKEGKDVTIIGVGNMVNLALDAAKTLAAEGIDAEVLDPRTLYPLDKEAIFKSIEKTHNVVLVTEEVKRGSFMSDVAAIIAEEAFDLLDNQIVRVGSLNTPIPFNGNMEDYWKPTAARIVDGVRKIK